MKKLVLSLVFAASTIASFGQGQVTFQNTSGTSVTLNGAAVTLANNLTAVLWFSPATPVPGSISSMTPIASTQVGQLSGTAVAGRFGGGVITTPNTIALGADAHFAVTVQQNFVSLANLGTQVGASGPFLRPTGAGGTDQPENLTTPLVGYGTLGAITIVPEPATITLAIVGIGALLLRRRKA